MSGDLTHNPNFKILFAPAITLNLNALVKHCDGKNANILIEKMQKNQ